MIWPRPRSDLLTSATIHRTCSPMSRNTEFSSRNWIVDQFTRSLSREEASCSTGDRCPSSRPATTTARTPGGAQLLGGQVGHERDHERQGGVDDAVGHGLADQADEPGDDDPDDDTAERGADEVQRHPTDADVADRQRRDGGPQAHQRRGVVDQRLALEQRDDATGQADPACDGRRGHRVRRRHDRTERERRGERHRQQPPRHQAHAERGEDHQPDREEPDGTAVLLEVDQGAADRGGVQQRRQQPHQHHLGGQVHLGDERQERGHHADQRQQQRRGQVEPARQSRHRRDGGEESEGGDGDRHQRSFAASGPRSCARSGVSPGRRSAGCRGRRRRCRARGGGTP